MSDDYGLLHQVAEQDSTPSEIGDAFYEGYTKLPGPLRKKLSLHDLRCIYEAMVHPVIFAVMDKMAPDEAATAPATDQPWGASRISDPDHIAAQQTLNAELRQQIDTMPMTDQPVGLPEAWPGARNLELMQIATDAFCRHNPAGYNWSSIALEAACKAYHKAAWDTHATSERESAQPDDCAEQQAKAIIERIWSVWYGDHRGDMPSDRFAITLGIAKQQIIDALRCAVEKSDKEMERVKACEHIAEGDMDGNDWRILRNICPSTMAVAELRDKYEALLKREIGGVILRSFGGHVQVLMDTPKGEVEIIKEYGEIISHWVNWSTVKELMDGKRNEIEGGQGKCG